MLPKRSRYEHLSSHLVLFLSLFSSPLHTLDRPGPVWAIEGRSLLSCTRTLWRQCRQHQREMAWACGPKRPTEKSCGVRKTRNDLRREYSTSETGKGISSDLDHAGSSLLEDVCGSLPHRQSSYKYSVRARVCANGNKKTHFKESVHRSQRFGLRRASWRLSWSARRGQSSALRPQFGWPQTRVTPTASGMACAAVGSDNASPSPYKRHFSRVGGKKGRRGLVRCVTDSHRHSISSECREWFRARQRWLDWKRRRLDRSVFPRCSSLLDAR